MTIYRTNLFFRSSLLLNNQLYLFLTTFWTEVPMTAPISFAHSPFLYQHVPNSPFLLPRRRQITQSPAPFVPDIDTLRENRYTGDVLLQNGKEKDCFGHTIKKVKRNVWCIMFNIRMVTVNNNSPWGLRSPGQSNSTYFWNDSWVGSNLSQTYAWYVVNYFSNSKG